MLDLQNYKNTCQSPLFLFYFIREEWPPHPTHLLHSFCKTGKPWLTLICYPCAGDINWMYVQFTSCVQRVTYQSLFDYAEWFCLILFFVLFAIYLKLKQYKNENWQVTLKTSDLKTNRSTGKKSPDGIISKR